ncbi:MAG: patatin family protein [Firmicutes bacterium]|nr:patatin family protein [Bacillota bacterium]
MDNTGLVLEGGAMRGLYTSGVLDYFIEKNLYFPYIIGVSAGACNALSYISRQKGRSKDININFANDKRYINFANIIRRENVFDLDFLFNDIFNKHIPFDYETFFSSDEELVIPCTDCETGKSVYYYKSKCKDILTAVKASSSLPFINSMVNINQRLLLDGGITDSIPIKKSIKDGNTRNIIILTRDKSYRKQPFKFIKVAEKIYKDYPNLVDAIKKRYKEYNKVIDYIEKLEQQGKVFVIRPKEPINIKRTERDVNKLKEIYNTGYDDGKKYYKGIMKFINKNISMKIG